jgi:spartin
MHTARNVVLVYVDMRGFARRALLKKSGVEFVKARIAKNKSEAASGTTMPAAVGKKA